MKYRPDIVQQIEFFSDNLSYNNEGVPYCTIEPF